MSVKSTKSDVSVVVGGYPERPQTPFSVTLALNNKPDESQKFNFGLIFTFVDEETEQTVNERVDNFVVNYTAD
ncbi:MAG: hypothetical protein MJ195_02730 [Mycoplasmoidaceae bacterium]|nr:hypothetical protein [Mycoplasmoidaceae bacterium]